MKKRVLSILLGLCMVMALLPATALAAAAESFDTFDYRAYANIYPDLKRAYGYDAEKLYAHYVNYGKAEGRVGTFISDSNPKTGAAIYGMASGSNVQSKDAAQAVVPATLLNPLPPTELSRQPAWSGEQCTHFSRMSNAKLVAEMLSAKSYMTEARAAKEAGTAGGKANWLNDTVMVAVDYIELELTERIDALEYQRNNAYYQRAMASDTAILTQYASNYYGLATPPADPGALPGKTTEKPAAATAGGFSDVLQSDYFAQAVLWAVETGVTNGTTATTFSPNMTCTRGQVVTFLWRTQGKPEPASSANPFTDVKKSDYCYKAVLWAVEQGITNGTTAATFSPNTTCTSGQVITFLYRANHPGTVNEPSNPYYAAAVAWAEEKELLSGTATVFAPGNDAPRSDIVYYLYRNSK
ncbi:MAG: S-layer homology domain-containing protein [Hominicoprocola sp.]